MPVFHIQSISISQSIGLGMVASFLTYRQIPEPKDKADNAQVVAFLSMIIRPLLIVLFGWIVQLFIG